MLGPGSPPPPLAGAATTATTAVRLGAPLGPHDSAGAPALAGATAGVSLLLALLANGLLLARSRKIADDHNVAIGAQRCSGVQGSGQGSEPAAPGAGVAQHTGLYGPGPGGDVPPGGLAPPGAAAGGCSFAGRGMLYSAAGAGDERSSDASAFTERTIDSHRLGYSGYHPDGARPPPRERPPLLQLLSNRNWVLYLLVAVFSLSRATLMADILILPRSLTAALRRDSVLQDAVTGAPSLLFYEAALLLFLLFLRIAFPGWAVDDHRPRPHPVAAASAPWRSFDVRDSLAQRWDSALSAEAGPLTVSDRLAHCRRLAVWFVRAHRDLVLCLALAAVWVAITVADVSVGDCPAVPAAATAPGNPTDAPPATAALPTLSPTSLVVAAPSAEPWLSGANHTPAGQCGPPSAAGGPRLPLAQYVSAVVGLLLCAWYVLALVCVPRRLVALGVPWVWTVLRTVAACATMALTLAIRGVTIVPPVQRWFAAHGLSELLMAVVAILDSASFGFSFWVLGRVSSARA